MSISYIKGTDSKEEFLKKKLGKSGSEATVMVNRQYINKFEIYCELVLKRNSELVIDDLINDWNENNDVTNLVNLISNFHECLKEHHPEITWKAKNSKHDYSWKPVKPLSQKMAVSIIRQYLRGRTGIRISAEDVSEKITIPVDTDEREEYPLTLEQFKKIYDQCTLLRRKVKYLFMRDTGCRTHESVQITKSMITFDFDNTGIAKVKLPKKIVKGKTKARINFLTPETAKMVQELCKDLPEDYPMFVSESLSNDTLMKRKDSEMTAFFRNRRSLIEDGFSEFAEKHESGTSKIVMHSIRAFTATAYSKGNGNSDDLGHGYIGHKKYLDQYIRRSEAEQLQMFKNAIPFLTGITKEYGESELAQKVKNQENQLNMQHRQIEALKKKDSKVQKKKTELGNNWKFVVEELLKLGIVEQTDIAVILSRAPKVVIPKE